ncbi:MAG: DUF2723 domain-containing protein [Dehalococcoidia bacterium]
MNPTAQRKRRRWTVLPPAPLTVGDRLFAALAAVVALLLYRQTLAPSVIALFDDTLEFPLVAERLAIPHPTGYPLYALLLKLFSWLPAGELGLRVNLLSAVGGALAVGALVALVLMLGSGGRRLTDRIAALTAGLLFAVSPVFWSQAVIAEVYTLAALLAVLVALATLRAVQRGSGWGWVALTIGLGLAHHRTFVLVLPAVMVFAWLSGVIPSPGAWRPHRIASTWWPMLIGPTLYLYLPLRAGVGSIDGTYRNDLTTFLGWVSGTIYSGFLADNPLARQADPWVAYANLLVTQATPVGLALAMLGLCWLLLRAWPLAAFLVVWYVPSALFAVLYRVADPEVFALPSLVPLFAASGAGMVAIGRLLSSLVDRIAAPWRLGARPIAVALMVTLLIVPVRAFAATYDTVDRSAEATVRAYGLDALGQPLPASSALIGLLGESSLFRYLQVAVGKRPDVLVRSADAEADRLAQVQAALDEGRDVYVTRPLAGLAERHHLSGVGPLIAVETNPVVAVPPGVRPINRTIGDLELLGYTSELIYGYGLGLAGPSDIRAVNRSVRVTLYWRAARQVRDDLSTFVHFSEPLGERWAQSDGRPVRGAYPTTLWRPGAVVADVHDLPLPLGIPPGDYILTAGAYRSSGESVPQPDPSRETRLGSQPLDSRPGGYTHARMDLEPAFSRFGGVTLIGQRLPVGIVRPGGQLSVETLWRGEREMGSTLTLTGELVAGERTIPLGSAPLGGRYTTIRWQPGEIVRDRETWRLPSDLPDGRYEVRLSLGEGVRQVIGTIEVAGRLRVYQVPEPLPNRMTVRLSGGPDLIGWDARAVPNGSDRQIEITLVWRAVGALDRDYSVFVHVISMNRIVAQHDGQPADGSAPTVTWLPNEIVVDRHLIILPPGAANYQLRVATGMYDPATGRRLSTARGDSIDLGLLRVDP